MFSPRVLTFRRFYCYRADVVLGGSVVSTAAVHTTSGRKRELPVFREGGWEKWRRWVLHYIIRQRAQLSHLREWTQQWSV